MKELADLAYRDNSSASRDFWKNELAQAIREIEHMYGEKLEDMKGDLDGFYNHKVNNVQVIALRSVSVLHEPSSAIIFITCSKRVWRDSL